MAATNILASGSGALASATVTVVSGTAQAVHGFGAAAGQWTAQVQIQDSAAGWNNVGNITDGAPYMLLPGPGTFRVLRPAGNAVAMGVDKD